MLRIDREKLIERRKDIFMEKKAGNSDVCIEKDTVL